MRTSIGGDACAAAVGSPFPISYVVIPLPPELELLPRRDVTHVTNPQLYVGVPLDGVAPLVTAEIETDGPNPDIDLAASGSRPSCWRTAGR